MFQTRSELKEQIQCLQERNDYLEKLIKQCEDSGLGKCKGAVCRVCEHAVFVDRGNGLSFLLGCDVDVKSKCEHYKRVH